MHRHVITLDMTGTTCTFYEREKIKENKEKQKRRKQIERENKYIEEQTVAVLPRRGCGRLLKRTS